MMVTRLTQRQTRYAVNSRRGGKSASTIARELKVIPRRIQQLYSEFCRTGRIHMPLRPGRYKSPPASDHTRQLVLQMHKTHPAGVLYTAKRLRANHVISYRITYQIMKDNGLVVPSATKSRRRKWVRFERRYSNAM